MKPLKKWTVYLGDTGFIKAFDNGVDAFKYVYNSITATAKGNLSYNIRLNHVTVWEEGDEDEKGSGLL